MNFVNFQHKSVKANLEKSEVIMLCWQVIHVSLVS